MRFALRKLASAWWIVSRPPNRRLLLGIIFAFSFVSMLGWFFHEKFNYNETTDSQNYISTSTQTVVNILLPEEIPIAKITRDRLPNFKGHYNNSTSNFAKISRAAYKLFKANPKKLRLTDLTSSKACAPVRGLKLVNSTKDSEQTYPYPADQTYFFDAPLVQCTKKTELFIVIKSSFYNFDRRSRSRETWLSSTACGTLNSTASRLCRWAMRRMSYAFFVSTPAGLSPEQANEQVKHGDVVQVSVVEHYHNMTLKTTSAMYWVVSRCRSAKYVLTMDDDVTLNVTNVWRAIMTYAVDRFIRNASSHLSNNDLLSADLTYKIASKLGYTPYNEYLLSGYLLRNRSVDRFDTHKTPESVYAPLTYPNYFPGWFTLMSFDVAFAIVRVAVCTEQFWIDDVYLTGLIPEYLGVERLNLDSYTSMPEYSDELVAKFVICLRDN